MNKTYPDFNFNGVGEHFRIIEIIAVLFLIFVGSAIVYFESWMPVLAPLVFLFMAYVIRDVRIIFYFIFIVIPFSIEFYFEPIGFGSDLPSEPLMILITVGSLIFMAKKKYSFPIDTIKNPVFIILVIHLCWILATTLNSQNVLTSFKFFLAKLWYVIPFFFFPVAFFRKAEDFIKVYRLLYVFLFISIVIVLTRHAFEGFTFASSYDVVRPFFRNHVSYAAISVICLPFVWAFFKTTPSRTYGKIFLFFILMVFLTGIYFSYTRAAILSVVFAVIAYFIFENRWVKHSLLVTFFTAGFLVLFLAIDNKYLDLTPNFERTITHTQFDNLIEATYKLEDISSMERVYRWMAGFEMLKNKPLMGFGPGTFYENYKSYSISQFATYVSDNPDKSGIHNYFLMTFVEQGVFGFIIFVLLCVLLLLMAEETWHMYKNDKYHAFVIAISLSFIIILSMNLINDLIETDKVGPFFFLNAAGLLYFRYIYKPNL
ncbi:MAG: O-antigen ligase family protein [Saprospiraceae bacterium]|nr:O-antigen ligase family protein [Saprospiraceae bacterium]MBK6566007.1 O-antigen ligase family protein [Saprospiraceae bacterium]MBK8369973.1 O-antigen ligase family protein [Saprospiraceae bacterium]MBK8548348.1 O-antigen ligase family protein [Saprospiraceae bacterium]MBK8855884.1 O-antigen ligase family protein [Saprospiraceae bacterium]